MAGPHEYNPYAAPESDVVGDADPQHVVGVWREGKTLVMYKGAKLADLCICCGRPANGIRLRKHLAWANPWWILLFLAIRLLGLIVIAFVTKRARVEFGICADHQAQRRRNIILKVVALFVGLGLTIGGAVEDQRLMEWGGVFLTLIVFVFAYRGQMWRTKRIDKEKVWINHLNEKYLAAYPTQPS